MRICPVCGKLNPEESRNCDVCGAPLHKVTAVSDPLPRTDAAPNNMSGPICPVCRRGNRTASMFCAYCGYRLKPAGGDGASVEAGIYVLFAMLGLTITVSPRLTGREVITALHIRYF